MSDSPYAVRLSVRDSGRAVAFDRDAVGWPLRFESAELGWAEFDLGGAALAVERAGDDTEHAGRFIGDPIRVEDVHARCAELEGHGTHFRDPPEHQPWGGTPAHFKHPNGIVSTLLGVPERGH